jgi:hypothetical protein
MGGIENVVVNTMGEEVHQEGRTEGYEDRQALERREEEGQTQEGFRKGQERRPVSLPGVGNRGRGVHVGS